MLREDTPRNYDRGKVNLEGKICRPNLTPQIITAKTANCQIRSELLQLKAVDPKKYIPAGAHMMNMSGPVDAAHDQGYITSSCYSPNLQCYIALGYLKFGKERKGEIMRLVSPHFIDPQGERLRA